MLTRVRLAAVVAACCVAEADVSVAQAGGDVDQAYQEAYLPASASSSEVQPDRASVGIGDFPAFVSRDSCFGTNPAVLITWVPAFGAQSLHQIRRAGGSLVGTVDTQSAGPNYLVSAGLIPHRSYEFYVESQDGQGLVLSNWVVANVFNDRCSIAGHILDPPGHFIHWNEPVFCDAGQPAVRLRWSPSAGAVSYRLTRHHPDGVITVTGLTGTAYLDSEDLDPGSFYLYEIHADSSAGSTSGGFSNLYVFVPSDICGTAGLPAPFSAFAESPYCENGEPAVRLNWSPPQNVQPIHHWKLTNGLASGSVNTPVTGYTKLIQAGIDPGWIYGAFVQLVSTIDSTKTRESNKVYFDIPLQVCGPPTLPPTVTTLAAKSIRSDRALLEGFVSANGSPTTYIIEYGTSTAYGESTLGFALGGGVERVRVGHLVTTLVCETTYHFRVAAQSAFGLSIGDDSSFTTDICMPGSPIFADNFESGDFSSWSMVVP